MVRVSATSRRVRAIVALVVMAGIGSAQAARTSDKSDASGGTVSIPVDPGNQTSAVDGVVRAVQLPRGASAISETYGDWIVKCQLDGGAKLCTLGQTQLSKETNQQIFAIELIPRDGKAEGNILMPFGLKFDAGAVLKLDGRDLEQTRFSTCTAQGCLLPVSFPTVVTDTLSKAKTLTVAAQNISNGQAQRLRGGAGAHHSACRLTSDLVGSPAPHRVPVRTRLK
ncbi:invasion associated locus B family protein [Bradyrhizobium sp. Ce-3]|uniref:invasion associated locus B family protein n=1 Tax=Bradyrhizobium sp. Ce-3 TaxID=2913970 RepID=UPI001FC7F253|nr:invasion associated locus B family protein [Bradyrhizobium sp. Ce-3]GKQ52801.1 invasion protein [Bradyrhizobium sp. Ce-3]